MLNANTAPAFGLAIAAIIAGVAFVVGFIAGAVIF